MLNDEQALLLRRIAVFAGPVSLERNTPWRKRPLPLGLVSLLLAAAAAVVVIVLTR